MAKKNVATATVTKVNKAKVIREYQEKNPGVKPAAIVTALAAEGIEVTANYIATVNYHQKGTATKKQGTVDYKQAYARLRSAGQAFKSIGGVTAAKKALEQVSQLGQALETTDISELLEMANSIAAFDSDTPEESEVVSE